jgi:AcrR family transcriptional regulator
MKVMREREPVSSRPRPNRDGSGPAARRAGRGGQGVDRRALILEAARRRFAEFGFEATTVRQIADDVEILSGSLYHHFETKEAMLDEIVRAPVLAMRDRTLAIAALPIEPEQRLVTLIAAELDALSNAHEELLIVHHERKLFRRTPDFAYVTMARKDAYEAWRGVLSEGVRDGLFSVGADEFLTISTVLRMLNTGADWYRHEDGAPNYMAEYTPFEKLLQFTIGFVLRAIRAPARAGAPIPDPHPLT